MRLRSIPLFCSEVYMLVDQLILSETAEIVGVSGSTSLGIQGQVDVNKDSLRWVCQDNSVITNIRAFMAIAATGQDLKFLLKKNGVKLTENPLVIPDGSDLISVAASTLIDDNLSVGDVLEAEIVQTGSTIQGYNFCVQVDYLTLAKNESTFVTELNSAFLSAMNISKSVVPFVDGSGISFDIIGFAEDVSDWASVESNVTPTQENFGSLTNVSAPFNSIKFKRITIVHNKSTDKQYLYITVAGAYLPQDLFESIYIKSLGKFNFADATYVAALTNNNMTGWQWEITDDQRKTFVAEANEEIRVAKNSLLEVTEENYLVPVNYTTSGGTYQHRGFRDWQDFSLDSNISGLMLNKTEQLRTVDVYHQTDINHADATVQVWYTGAIQANEEFGAITIPGIGRFAASAATNRRVNYLGNTYWRWNLRREQAWNNYKTGSDLTEGPVTIDAESPVHDRVFNVSGFTDGAGNIWRGTWLKATSYQSARGSNAYRTIQYGTELVAISSIYQPQNGQYGFLIRVNTKTPASDLFEYVDVDGFGRFYKSKAGPWSTEYNGEGMTQYFWTISIEKFNDFPTSGSINFQLKL